MLQTNRQPIFSVIVPVFNKESFLFKTIESVLDQDFQDLEVIIVDDGSQDNSLAVARRFTDPRVTLLSQKNMGVSVARNLGLRHATGDFVCFLDADDYWSRSHLSILYRFVDLMPDASIFATGYTEVESDSACQDNHYHTVFPEGLCASMIGFHDFVSRWFHSPFIWTGSICIRRELLSRLNFAFPPGENKGEDQDLWFRLLRYNNLVLIGCKETAFYRRGITESLSFHGNLNILPAYIRLRSNLDTVDAKSAAAVLKLYDRHLLQTAWHNILQSRRAKAFDLWRRASFFKDPQYWTRVFIFLIFGGKFARYLRSIPKM